MLNVACCILNVACLFAMYVQCVLGVQCATLTWQAGCGSCTIMMTCNTRVTTLSVNMHCSENKYDVGVWLKHSSWREGHHLTTTCLLQQVLGSASSTLSQSSRTQNSSSNSPFEIRICWRSNSRSSRVSSPTQARSVDLHSWWSVLGWKHKTHGLLKLKATSRVL